MNLTKTYRLVGNHPFAIGLLGITTWVITCLAYWILRAWYDYEGIDNFPTDSFFDRGLVLAYLVILNAIVCIFFLIKKNWAIAFSFATLIGLSVIVLLFVGAMY